MEAEIIIKKLTHREIHTQKTRNPYERDTQTLTQKGAVFVLVWLKEQKKNLKQKKKKFFFFCEQKKNL